MRGWLWRNGRAAMVLAPLVIARPLQGQELRDHLADLFQVGDQSVPFRVSEASDPADPNTMVVPDDAFSPSAGGANAAILTFLTKWVSAYPGNLPVSATSGGVTFQFAGGAPVRGTVSAGPILNERAATLGRQHMAVGVDFTELGFTTLRGLPLDNVRLLFTQANTTDPACTAATGQDCAPLGVPVAENDLLEVLLSLHMRMRVASVYASYGLLDRLDVGVVVPVVQSRLDATSVVSLLPFGTSAAGVPSHFLAGTPAAPVLTSTQGVHGSATGIGDMALRAKLRVLERRRVGVALLGDVRLATGREGDFLGSGHTAVRALGVVSGQFGSFAPHLNVGYLWRNAAVANDAILGAIGFDQVLAPWATFAAGLLGELQIGQNVMQVPAPVTFTAPVVRTIVPMDVPQTRDDPVSATVGVKFSTLSNLTATVNALIPVTRTGPRPDWAWSTGLEYDF